MLSVSLSVLLGVSIALSQRGVQTEARENKSMKCVIWAGSRLSWVARVRRFARRLPKLLTEETDES